MSNISLLLSQASNASFFEPNTCDAPSVRQSFQFQRVSPFSSHQKSRNISNPVGIVPPRRSICSRLGWERLRSPFDVAASRESRDDDACKNNSELSFISG